MAISFGIDDYIEGGVITAVILLNIVVGYVSIFLLSPATINLHVRNATG